MISRFELIEIRRLSVGISFPDHRLRLMKMKRGPLRYFSSVAVVFGPYGKFIKGAPICRRKLNQSRLN